jgi:hypothetical protein
MNPSAQVIKHRANHSSVELFMSINTHQCGVNHSSAMLLWIKRKKKTFQIVTTV